MKIFGTIYWIAVTIFGFFLTFGSEVHPLLVYFIAGVFFLLIWAAVEWCKNAHEENVKHRVKEIENKYPRAYSAFRAKKLNHLNYTDSLEIICSRSSKVWEKEEKELVEVEEKHRRELAHWHNEAERIKTLYPEGYKKWETDHFASDHAIFDAENEIKTLDQQVYIKKWENEQSIFTKHCRDLHDELLGTFGCYVYDIDLPFDNVKTTLNYRVWQMFPNSFCSAEDLDYTDFPTERLNGNLVKEYDVSPQMSQIHAIAAYVNQLNSEERTSVYFCPLKEEWDDDIYIGIKAEIDSSIDCLWGVTNWLNPVSSEIKWVENVYRRIVIIDIATENDRLITICKELINKLEDKCPLISFVSIMKGYSRGEMLQLIDKKKEEILARQKIEKRNKAVSLCEKYPRAAGFFFRNFLGIKDTPEITDENADFLVSFTESQYQKYEDKIRAKEVSRLLESVSSWENMIGDMRYSYLFYYFPTTCEFEATEEEWNNRWIVWNFKNTPGKTSVIEHQETLNKVILMLKDKLVSTFGTKNLRNLTFVCIPASSQAKTQARYEEFSDCICNKLGMTNAYPYIRVESENKEKHLGGTGLDTTKQFFDREFFKGKYVLLFDDVITKGNSMRIFKRKMESLGAIVVGGLALGKTKHERPD